MRMDFHFFDRWLCIMAAGAVVGQAVGDWAEKRPVLGSSPGADKPPQKTAEFMLTMNYLCTLRWRLSPILAPTAACGWDPSFSLRPFILQARPLSSRRHPQSFSPRAPLMPSSPFWTLTRMTWTSTASGNVLTRMGLSGKLGVFNNNARVQDPAGALGARQHARFVAPGARS